MTILQQYSSGLNLLLLLSGIIIPSFVTQSVEAEYFSSIDTILKLDELELALVETYRQYLQNQKTELTEYRNFIEHVKSQHEEAVLLHKEEYLANSTNAYTLIKRIVVDWRNLKIFIENDHATSGLSQALKELINNTPIPDKKEIRGAVQGIARLQNVYNLSTTDLVDGIINGVSYGSLLSWEKCFEIAVNLHEEKKYTLAITWFQETLRFLENYQDQTIDDVEIREEFLIQTYEHLTLIHNQLGNISTAIFYIENLLAIYPKHVFKGLKTYLKQQPIRKQQQQPKANDEFYSYENYTRLCRGIQVAEQIHHRLKCKFDTKNHNPAFLLTPLQMEEVSLDPEVILYHSLLNDKDIASILLEGSNTMKRSVVNQGSTNVIQDVRISQQAWVDYISPPMRKIYRLVAKITGFNLHNSERMQVANYGIGGQYDPHHDYIGNESSLIGDRISTSMFYLSDVEQGGYTVFPQINIYLRPVKGALVMWYNLHKSLAEDARTLHAGCPVIKGTKRIGNVWVHSGYQEFARPCGLRNDVPKT